jgi:hypothetical protein
VHGEYVQIPINHLNGHGCIYCNPITIKSTTDEFIKKAKESVVINMIMV